MNQTKRAENIRNYKYNGTDKSILRRYFVKPYILDKIINYIPKRLAPNLITLTGFFFMTFNLIFQIVFDPNLLGDRRVSIVSLVCLFLYYTLDNLDGMQARKTLSSSPLGQMFDHTIDSIVINFVFLALCSSLGMGKSLSSLLLVFAGQIGFILPTLEEKYTNKFVLGYINGTCEGIFLVLILHAISLVCGSTFLSSDILENSNKQKFFNYLIILCCALMFFINISKYVKHIRWSFFYEILVVCFTIFESFYCFQMKKLSFYEVFFFQTIIFSNFLMQILDSHMSKKKPMPMFIFYFYPIFMFVQVKYVTLIAIVFCILEYLIDIIGLVRFYQNTLNICWYKIK